jgi:ubiquitin-conjugating enzyme E2 variant
VANVSYSKAHRALEIIGVTTAYSMVAVLLYRLGRLVKEAYVDDTGEANWLLGVILGAAAGGYLLADLLSGLVHWGFDRYGTDKTPLLGENFVRPFRFHHVDPKDITRHDFLETNGNNCLVTIPVLAGLLWGPFDLAGNTLHLIFVSMFTFIAVFTFATNQFHKWSHEDAPPALVAWLQERGLILAREHHQVHHTFPYESHYCITTGWLNRPLSAIRFWSTLELVIEKVLGVKAHRDAAPVELPSVGVGAPPAP